MKEDIKIPYENAAIPAYLSAPDGQAQRPGLILIHEAWGLTDHIRDVADRLSTAGYEVIAPDVMVGTEIEKLMTPDLVRDMHDPDKRAERQVELRAILAPLNSPEFSDTTLEKLQTCFSYLKIRSEITKIGVMGFCFGGTYSFTLAVNQPGLGAAVAFYGKNDHPAEELSQMNCPVLAFYGDQDTGLTEGLAELVDNMQQSGAYFEHKVYPGTGHAFFNDHNPATYHSEAAADAWQLTLRFLRQHLQS